MKSTVWTGWRQFAGNLLPGIVWAVPTVWGVLAAVKTGQFLGMPLIAIIFGVLAGWVATNFLGLFQNKKMRKLIEEVIDDGLDGRGVKFFVGFAEPGGGSMWDPHDHVGFLVFDKDCLRFIDDVLVMEMPRSVEIQLKRRANIHSLFGLGGWLEIRSSEQVWLIEPREKNTLLGNKKVVDQIQKEFTKWLK